MGSHKSKPKNFPDIKKQLLALEKRLAIERKFIDQDDYPWHIHEYFYKLLKMDLKIVTSMLSLGDISFKGEVRLMAQYILDEHGWTDTFIDLIKDTEDNIISKRGKAEIIHIFRELDNLRKNMK